MLEEECGCGEVTPYLLLRVSNNINFRRARRREFDWLLKHGYTRACSDQMVHLFRRETNEAGSLHLSSISCTPLLSVHSQICHCTDADTYKSKVETLLSPIMYVLDNFADRLSSRAVLSRGSRS